MTPEQAAGVLCWRRARDGLEVLLVHRPRYDDWSWPKGKVKESEPLPRTAVRECAEETGLDVALGRPLGEVHYPLPDGRPKIVTYWAARAAGHGTTAPADVEVDGLAWLPLGEARAVLTRSSDADPLRLLEEYANAGSLATVALLVVRHGTSRPRDSWARADADRPLISAGRRQARGLVALLPCWRPERLVSSPWRRCIDTLIPFATSSGLGIATKASLTEDGARRNPRRTRRTVQRMLDRTQPAALCTHRPVLAEVFDVVRSAGVGDAVAGVPGKDPYLSPGEVLVAHVSAAPGQARVVAVERHHPLP